MINLIEIQFDGGALGNPGAKYGSFAVWHQINHRPKHLLVKQLKDKFGHGTNNEAEFEALLAALKWTNEALDAGGFFPKDFSVKLFTDSAVVGFRLKNNSKNKTEPQQRMFALAAECLKSLIRFKAFGVDFINRDKNVALFGH